MQDFIEAIKQGLPFAVQIYDNAADAKPDLTAAIAEVFLVPGAMMFVDIGWLQTPSHPFHRALGWQPKPAGPGMWIGRTKRGPKALTVPKIGLRIVGPDDPWHDQVQMWRDYQARTPHTTREDAWERLVMFFGDMDDVKRIA